jgi:hypothetical protein
VIAKSVSQQWTRQLILPQIYQNRWHEHKPAESQAEGLKQNTLLKVVSWNINFSDPMPKVRVATLMNYLQKTFGDDPGRLIILLQEVSEFSAQQVMRMQLVQDNFIVIGHEPPRTFQAGIPRRARYYTMAMTPRSLRSKTPSACLYRQRW